MNQYLLYIDILGFREMVGNSTEKISKVHKSILEAKNWYENALGLFHLIVFSDTILAFRIDKEKDEDQTYLRNLLLLAQYITFDLLNEEVFLRAVLVREEFHYFRNNDLDLYYGEALINAYDFEKAINSIGLFIERDIETTSVHLKNDFTRIDHNDKVDMLLLNRDTKRIDSAFIRDGVMPSIDSILGRSSSQLERELLFLRLLHKYSEHSSSKIREKHISTLHYYRKECPGLFELFKAQEFDYNKIISRYP